MIKTRVSFITSILKFQNCRQNWIYEKQLRNLTLFGKASIIKPLRLSQIVYTASNVNVKIKRESIHQDCNKGRIRMTDVDLMIKILRLAWSPTVASWNFIPDFFFEILGGLNFLLRCNYYKKYLDPKLPVFYKVILKFFSDIKFIYICTGIGNYPFYQ